jgi:hypothetical protein
LVVVQPTLLILKGFRVWHTFEGCFISNSVEGQGLLLKVVSSMLEEVKFLIVVALKILNSSASKTSSNNDVESDKNIEYPRNKGEKLQSRYSSQTNDLNAC